MLIEKIVLNNFRVYRGENSLDFSLSPTHNVSIVAGNNGYGKTSLLTSLVWCLYGKLMADVDPRYRQEIYEAGGYKRYCHNTMNRLALSDYEREYSEMEPRMLESVSSAEKDDWRKAVLPFEGFSVTVQFAQIIIPSLPCNEVAVKRTYNVITGKEEVQILIDGRTNELAKNVGEDIFINDFIIPKEIAKFFFFDAEKIVALAEISTTEEKLALSRAYAEVLGLKKYIDLKENLENLRVRLRRKMAGKEEEERLEKLTKQQKQLATSLECIENLLIAKNESLIADKQFSDRLQEQLIREGSSLSLEELKEFKALKESLSEEGRKLKARLVDMMDLVPLAIAAGKLRDVKSQLDKEQIHAHHNITSVLLEKKLTEIKAAVKQYKRVFALDKEKEFKLFSLIEESLLSNNHDDDFTLLLNFSFDQYNRFRSVYSTLANSFNHTFRQLLSEQKRQQSAFQIVQRKLTDAETKEKDPVVLRIRKEKTAKDEAIRREEAEIIELEAQKLQIQTQLASLAKVANELAKNLSVDKADGEKDFIAERLISKLSTFIRELQLKKKASLEQRIQAELSRLMHKADFVKKVVVRIEGDLIDIDLLDGKGAAISKEDLSKGEQQLYATALLKALIDESNIQFPVFIDSPLQKFDKQHSKNIITDFYPAVGAQVILFPLLEKELNEEEYNWLLPQVANTYLILNGSQHQSRFMQVAPADLFSKYQNVNYVHQH